MNNSNAPLFGESDFFRSLSWMSCFMGMLHDDLSERHQSDLAEVSERNHSELAQVRSEVVKEVKEWVEQEFNLVDTERAMRADAQRRHEAEMIELLEESRNPPN